MKVIFVIDSLKDIKEKVALFKTHFGNDILFVADSNFEAILPTFGIVPNAVYGNNLTRLLHKVLSQLPASDTVMYYSSFDVDDAFLQTFLKKIGAGEKVVNVEPRYNVVEKVFNWGYNIYVKSLFKIKDSLSSPKIQYLPKACVTELLSSNFANKLFEVNPDYVKKMQVEDKQQNKSLKTKIKFDKDCIIPIIIAIIITMVMLFIIAEFRLNFVGVIIFIAAYVLDIAITYMFRYKQHFDARFFNK